jgi:MazG family protein
MEDNSEPAFRRLFEIVRRLRSPDGCQWDREQTPATLRGSIIEEAYECAGAITAGDDANLAEELGDLYLLATMVAWMKEQDGTFSVREVLDAVSDKLVRRHPHVFAEAQAKTSAEVVSQWERIKSSERPDRDPSSALARLSGSLPPLERAARIQELVSRVGFDWKSPQPVWEKLREEAAELEEAAAAGDRGKVEDEVGDLLFTVVNLSRLLGVDPGVALHGTNEKFSRRFRGVEERLKAQGLTPAQAGLERMDRLWNQIKAEEQNSSK